MASTEQFHVARSNLMATMPRITHGFFSRPGGVSTHTYRGLNRAYRSEDLTSEVNRHRELVATHLGIAPSALCGVEQIHSNTVVCIEQPTQEPLPAADAIVTQQRKLGISILTADCAPVLFACENPLVVAAAHAGWKGALTGVLEQTVNRLTYLGAQPHEIIAAVGPCITQDSYEVRSVFRDKFIKHAHSSEKFFVASGGRYLFDLPGFIEEQLKKLGITKIDNLLIDTYSQPSHYFSYRRATHNNYSNCGRQISAILVN